MKNVLKGCIWKVVCLSLLLFPAISIAANSASTLIPVYALLLFDGPTYHKVNVLTEGLVGDGFSIILNGKEELPIPADGQTSFPAPLENFSNYEIIVKSPVTGIDQACRIGNGTGIISSADAEVTIDCTILDYPIGGTVTGLDGSGLLLVLENKTDGGFQRRVLKANGSFTLAALPDRTEYEASILSQPDDNSQTCTLTNATGTVTGSSINNLEVSCVTNQIPVHIYRYDLPAGDSVTIADNGPGWTPAPTSTVNGTNTDGAVIRLSSPWVVDGRSYDFAVVGTSVQGNKCYLSNRSGIADNVVSMDLRCFPENSRMGTVGGVINNIGIGSAPSAADIKLSLNDGLDFITVKGVTGDTPFIFNLPLWLFDAPLVPNIYSVSIARQPRDAICTVDANATGSMSTAVADVHVQCTPYNEPVAQVAPEVFIPNLGPLDASLTSYGDSSTVNFIWDTASTHDFLLTGNGTTDPSGVTISTDKFEDPLYLDEVVCANNPLCLDDIISNGFVIDATVASTNTTLYVIGDEGHESTDSGDTLVYDDSLAYVKKAATGSGASPNDPAGDIKIGINYAKNNGKRGVAISQGTYTIDVDSSPINMVEGVSLFGGYSASTWVYDPETYITDIRGSGVGILNEMSDYIPIATVVAGPTITSRTWIKGLTIYSPNVINSMATTALLIEGGDVTVKKNILRAHDRGRAWNGLTITDNSEALIQGNTIYASGSSYDGEVGNSYVGTGIAIFNSSPTIESNKIRGGGGRGVGVTVIGSMPNIFNSTILGCEDSAQTQECIGVSYADGINQSGGKLYNNTIFGSKSFLGAGSDLGGKGVAIRTLGTSASPEIVNNILHAQNNGAGGEIDNVDRAACIQSFSAHKGAMPASMYNNACAIGLQTCFHLLQVPESQSGWEEFWDHLVSALEGIYNRLTSGNPWDVFIAAHELLLFPLTYPGYIAYEDITDVPGTKWSCLDAQQSNSYDQWLATYQQFFPDYQDFLASFPSVVPSNGNVDINRISFYLSDFEGPDNDFSDIYDNDWSLTGSAPIEVIEGGKCVAPDVHLDMDRRAPRTPGWTVATGCHAETGYSMGAYEYDY